MQSLRVFYTAYTHRKVNIAFTIWVQPIIYINRTDIVTVDPNRPTIVGKALIL